MWSLHQHVVLNFVYSCYLLSVKKLFDRVVLLESVQNDRRWWSIQTSRRGFFQLNMWLYRWLYFAVCKVLLQFSIVSLRSQLPAFALVTYSTANYRTKHLRFSDIRFDIDRWIGWLLSKSSWWFRLQNFPLNYRSHSVFIFIIFLPLKTSFEFYGNIQVQYLMSIRLLAALLVMFSLGSLRWR